MKKCKHQWEMEDYCFARRCKLCKRYEKQIWVKAINKYRWFGVTKNVGSKIKISTILKKGGKKDE